MPKVPSLQWRRLYFRRPITSEQIVSVLRLWANDPSRPPLVLECRITGGRATYLLGAPEGAIEGSAAVLVGVMPGTQVIEESVNRVHMQHAVRLAVRGTERSLRFDQIDATIQAVLAAAAGPTANGTTSVIQLVLGDRRPARRPPTPRPSTKGAHPAWVISHAPVTSDDRSALRSKLAEPSFGCVIRIGTTDRSGSRSTSVLRAIYQALGSLQAAGVRFRPTKESPARLHQVRVPWFWQQYLNIEELAALTIWPIGEGDLAGVDGLHPVKLPPRARLPDTQPDYVVARAAAPGHTDLIGLDVTASLRGTWLLGPPGVGKSNLLSTLVLRTIEAGRGGIFLEPKGDAIESVLQRIDARHQDRIVVLDPTDAMPVGLNPLVGGQPDVRAEGLLEIFISLYGDAIGPRSRDILHNSLLTLARHGEASLPMLSLLLTNPGFRRSITQRVSKEDPLAVGAYWQWYDQLSDGERTAAIAPVLNKVRAFTINRHLRAVLGQRRPKFSMRQVLEENKVLLVPLQSGIVGESAARLLGSLVVAEAFQAIKGRVAVPEHRRPPVIVTIDELHQFVHLADLGEAMALFRGYGVGFQLANQHIGQLPKNLRESILSTVRSRVIFQTGHRDAVELAKGHPEIAPDDFTRLGAYEVYASLMDHNTATPYVYGRTIELPPAISDGRAIREASRQQYGQPLDEVEADLLDLVTTGRNVAIPNDGITSGRRRRQS